MAMLRSRSRPMAVVIALKGTQPGFPQSSILSSLATRTRRLVEHELASGDPAPQTRCAGSAARGQNLALEMASRGEIELNPEQNDDPVLR